MSKHAPLPWTVSYRGESIVIDQAGGVRICEVARERDLNYDEHNANTEHIIRCVNVHDDLLNELKRLVESADEAGWHQSETAAARAVIAKAENEEPQPQEVRR